MQVRDGVNSLITTTAEKQENLATALTAAEASLRAYLAEHPSEATDQNLQVLIATLQGVNSSRKQ